MTPEEVARYVLVPLAAAWPKQEIPPATAALWCNALAGTSITHAEATTKVVLSTERSFPAPAVWLNQHRIIARALAGEVTQPELPRTPGFEAGQTDTVRAGIAGARALLRKAARDTRQETEPQANPTDPTEGAPDARRQPV